jgi:hypothetical protein
MIAFIDDHRGAHGVEPICKVWPIAPSTYHAHVAKRRDPAKLSARATQDAALKVDIWRVFEENFSVYGVRKVWRQLKRDAPDAGHGPARGDPGQIRQNHGQRSGRAMCPRRNHQRSLQGRGDPPARAMAQL